MKNKVIGLVIAIITSMLIWGLTSTATTVSDLDITSAAHEARITNVEKAIPEIKQYLIRIETKLDTEIANSSTHK